MKISVFIPCIPSHYCLLNRVIDSYFAANCLWPDEIVVVISDSNKVNPEYIELLKKEYSKYAFNFVIYTVPMLLYKGEACNMIKALCTGDVIVVQDADDLPHRSRIKVVKKYFDENDIISLNHSYWSLNDITYYGMDKLDKMTEDKLFLKIILPNEIKQHVERYPDDVYGQGCGFKVCDGAVCFRKELVEKVKWSSEPRGQDKTFCKEVIKKFCKSIIVDAPVYYYYK